MKNYLAWTPIIFVGILYSVYLVPQVLGTEAYVVKSGSMSPSIPEGSLIYNTDEDPSNIEEGDVVTYMPHPNISDEERITHRVIDVEEGNYTHYYTTKGDANSSPDPEPIPAYRVTGITEFSIPYIGYVLTGIYSIPAFLALVFLPGIYLIRDQLSNLFQEMDSEGSRIPTED